MKKTLLIATALMTWALSPSAAQDILHSLPAEVQKNIEDMRAGCREHLKTIDDDRIKILSEITSGDDGLVQFTLSGAPAVMVDKARKAPASQIPRGDE